MVMPMPPTSAAAAAAVSAWRSQMATLAPNGHAVGQQYGRRVDRHGATVQ
jgi:hypothetical protein